MSIATTERVTRADAGFDPIPSPHSAATIQVADTVPGAATIVGIPVYLRRGCVRRADPLAVLSRVRAPLPWQVGRSDPRRDEEGDMSKRAAR